MSDYSEITGHSVRPRPPVHALTCLSLSEAAALGLSLGQFKMPGGFYVLAKCRRTGEITLQAWFQTEYEADGYMDRCHRLDGWSAVYFQVRQD